MKATGNNEENGIPDFRNNQTNPTPTNNVNNLERGGIRLQ